MGHSGGTHTILLNPHSNVQSQENALFFYALHLFRFSLKKTHATFHFNQNLFIHLRLFLIQKLLLRDHTNKTAFICQNNNKGVLSGSEPYIHVNHIFTSFAILIALNNKGTRVAHFFQPCTQKNCIYAFEHMKFVCSVNIYTSNTVIPSIFGFLFTLL